MIRDLGEKKSEGKIGLIKINFLIQFDEEP